MDKSDVNYSSIVCKHRLIKTCSELKGTISECENCEWNINYSYATIGGWQTCPKCQGQGTISKPPGIAGDVTQWASADCVYTCDVCNGKKIIDISTGNPPV